MKDWLKILLAVGGGAALALVIALPIANVFKLKITLMLTNKIYCISKSHVFFLGFGRVSKNSG